MIDRILTFGLAALFGAAAFGQTPAVSDPSFFAKTLYPVLEKAQCRLCHNDNGVASATRLQFPTENASPETIARFGLHLKILVDAAQPGQSLLFRKPTNRLQHTGGERIHPGSPEEKVLLAWVQFLATYNGSVDGSGDRTGEAPAILRRLTHSQYDHTVLDLLGDQTHPASQFPNEDFVHGFTNQAEEQSISPLQAEAYSQAAAKMARNAFRGGDLRGLVPCKPTGPDDAACRTQFIRKFGQRAFRRPLSDAELRLYDKLFRAEAVRGKDFYAGAQVVTETMLQSPYFLFHLEGGPTGEWEPYRVASRLSYFLWDTMPDQALFHAAETGQLASAAGFDKQLRRLLADERARGAFDEFLAQWLRFDRLRTAVRDHRYYPDFSTELVNNMIEEVRQMFEHLVWENGNFLDFFKADYGFLSTDLAKLYGVAPPPREFAMVKFPVDSERAGIVGSGLFLSLTSKPSETSPTERGLFVREHFLCQIVPPPPPGVNTTLPPLTDEHPVTNRERLKAHLTEPRCAACHTLIDSIGFGLERFDAIGHYRAKQEVTIFPTLDELKTKKKQKPTTYALDLDTNASVRGIPNSAFNSPKQLAEILAATPACQRCVVKQLFRYAMGRSETEADQPTLDAALKDFRDSQFHYQNLITSIVKSRTFLGGPGE